LQSEEKYGKFRVSYTQWPDGSIRQLNIATIAKSFDSQRFPLNIADPAQSRASANRNKKLVPLKSEIQRLRF
jgi:hypothetical protein